MYRNKHFKLLIKHLENDYFSTFKKKVLCYSPYNRIPCITNFYLEQWNLLYREIYVREKYMLYREIFVI